MANETAADTPSLSLERLVHTLQQTDPQCTTYKGMIAANSSPTQPPFWLDSTGLLRRAHAVVVLSDSALRAEILRTCHDDRHAGHFGRERTLELLLRKYWWKHVARDVRHYVLTCAVCQRSKAKRHEPFGVLIPLPQSTAKFPHLTMNFITDLPASRDRLSHVFDSILVVMDRFTKMAIYIPVTKTINSADLAATFVDHVSLRCGNSQTIVSDRGSVFTSRFWSALCLELGIKSHLSTAFHPKTDGQTERQIQTLEQYLRAYVNYQQNDWVTWLFLVVFSYNNNSRHAETRMSPFLALMGYHPQIDLCFREQVDPGQVPEVDRLTTEMKELQEVLQEEWAQATTTQAKYYDLKRQPKSFATGNCVYLSSRNIKTRRPTKKLDWKWLGPFRILEPVGKRAYRLDLPESAGRLHPVFNVSLLSPSHSRPRTKPHSLPTLEVDGETEWYVDSIDNSRVRTRKREFLVYWRDTDHTIDSWEPFDYVKDTAALDTYLKLHPDVIATDSKESRRRIKPRSTRREHQY